MNMKGVVLGTLALAVIVAALRAQQPARSVWDRVYTDDQARRGRPVYVAKCEDCHGQSLEGDAEAPPLSGGAFITNWNGLGLDKLYERIHRDMPADRPGTLNRNESTDVLAYMLSYNGFPPGDAELPSAPQVLAEIRFEAENPRKKR